RTPTAWRYEGEGMSTAVYVYSVPVDRLRDVQGSKDKKLLTAARKLKGFFDTIDEIAEDLFDDEDEKPPSCATAYKQIVNGEEFDKEYGYVYGYAYEGLCRVLGAETKESWTAISQSYDWFEDIDKELAKLQIKLKVTDLLYRGAVLDIPKPEDFPG